MKGITLRTILAGAALALSAMGSSAATVQFGPTGWVNQNGTASSATYVATLTDISGGVSFSVDLAAGSVNTGDILLIGFGGPTLTSATFANVATNTGDGITNTCFNASSCGGGGGFTGGSFNSYTFGTLVRIGTNGSASGLNTSVAFDIDLAGLTAADFTTLGLRVQTVGASPDGGGGSLKLRNDDPTTVSTVPVPAAGVLLIGALGGLGLLRRRKSA